MEVDEPYDFMTWHSNAPAVKDEKKEKVTVRPLLPQDDQHLVLSQGKKTTKPFA